MPVLPTHRLAFMSYLERISSMKKITQKAAASNTSTVSYMYEYTVHGNAVVIDFFFSYFLILLADFRSRSSIANAGRHHRRRPDETRIHYVVYYFS